MTVFTLIFVAILLALIVESLRRQGQQRAADKKSKAAAYTGEADAQQEASRAFRERQRASYAAAHAGPAQTPSDAGD